MLLPIKRIVELRVVSKGIMVEHTTNTVVRDCCNDFVVIKRQHLRLLILKGYRALDRESPNRGFDLDL